MDESLGLIGRMAALERVTAAGGVHGFGFDFVVSASTPPILTLEQVLGAERLFNMERVATITGDRIKLPSGRRNRECEIAQKITPEPKQNPDFYELAALQHDWLARHGERNPAAEMARINEVPLSTAQGWLVKARSLGLLPPGRRGRRGTA